MAHRESALETPLGQGAHLALVQVDGLDGGSHAVFVNWLSPVTLYGQVIEVDKQGRLIYGSVPRADGSTRQPSRSFRGCPVIHRDVGVVLRKAKGDARSKPPDHVHALKRMWDVALSDTPVSISSCVLCEQVAELTSNFQEAVWLCPFCLIPSHKGCMARLFQCIDVQRDIMPVKAGGVGFQVPPLFRQPVRSISQPRLCLACEAVSP
eukprot:13098383-Alexandrium_andersonii.AAC.1